MLVLPPKFAVVNQDLVFRPNEALAEGAPLTTVRSRFYWLYTNLVEETFGISFDFESHFDFCQHIGGEQHYRKSALDLHKLFDLSGFCWGAGMKGYQSFVQVLKTQEYEHAFRELVSHYEDPSCSNLVSGDAVACLMAIVARMLLGNEVNFWSADYFHLESGIPHGHWKMQEWKTQVEANAVSRRLRTSLNETVGYSVQHRLDWLSNLDLDDVIRFRSADGLSEIRSLFRESRDSISSASAGDLQGASSQLSDAICKHMDLEVSKLYERRDLLPSMRSIASATAVIAIGAADLWCHQ